MKPGHKTILLVGLAIIGVYSCARMFTSDSAEPD